MRCDKCKVEVKQIYDSKWFTLETRAGVFKRYDICPPCGDKIIDWLKTEAQEVNLELVRRPR